MKVKTKQIIKLGLLSVSTVLWLGFIFSNSLKTGSQSAQQSEVAEITVQSLLSRLGFSENIEAIAEIAVRKAAHIFEFFVLFLLFTAVCYLLLHGIKASAVLAAATTFACAITDECLQILSHRGASLRDVFIDSVGILIGVAVIWLARKIKPQKA